MVGSFAWYRFLQSGHLIPNASLEPIYEHQDPCDDDNSLHNPRLLLDLLLIAIQEQPPTALPLPPDCDILISVSPE